MLFKDLNIEYFGLVIIKKAIRLIETELSSAFKVTKLFSYEMILSKG